LIWGSVLTASGLIALGWLDLGLPTPFCPLHALTGIPCPTCGMTRGLGCLLQGQIEEALLFNPLMMVALLSALLYLLYAGVVVIGRLPRLRWEPLSRTAAICVRIGAVLLIAVNWIYLMCARI
jgi:hypothetical protein